MTLTKKDILTLIQQDAWMMHILKEVQTIGLPDWWIGAGFVRGKVWDYLHGYTKKTPLPDIDIIYFDKENISEEKEKEIEKILSKKMPQEKWQVRNQARMHTKHNDMPYKNATEGLSHWVETATCIGIQLNNKNELELTAPLGIDDLVHLTVRKNPLSYSRDMIFKKRLKEKNWQKSWPKLEVVNS